MEGRIPIGQRVRVIRALNNINREDNKMQFLGQPAKVIRDWADLSPYVLEFENPEYEEVNKRVGKYCWQLEELDIILDEIKEPEYDDKVLVIAIYEDSSEDYKMKSFIGHTARVIDVSKYSGDHPVQVRFIDDDVQDYYNEIGEPSFDFEELFVINDLYYEEPVFIREV